MRHSSGGGSDGADGPVVTLAAGQVRGIERGAVAAWLGLPFAEPPVGRRRFRAPEPKAPWTGVRPATRFAGVSYQSGALGSARRLGTGASEDCLYLNVYAPVAARTDGRPRPVLVWVHGGAFSNGAGALYDGAPLAEQGDVVVVTVNYRLGVFGFVDFAAVLDADVPANLGLRDQLAALTWVRDNIAAFGGDPAQLTVAGESAGSISVALMLSAPAAAGLFRGAVMESGSYSLIHGPEVHQEVARAYARLLGLGRADGARLWQLPAADLVRAQATVDRQFPGTLPAAPWFDGDLVPDSLAAARAAVRPEVALLVGHNRDEATFFQRLSPNVMPTTRPALQNRLRAELGWDAAQQILDAYPATAAGTTALGTDLNWAMPTLHFAERHAGAGGRTWFYRFDAAVPLLGATHAAELPYLWSWSGLPALFLRGRLTPERRALAARLRRRWLAFVRDADPGPDWPPFSLPRRRTLVLDPAGDRVLDDPARPRREIWAGRDVMPRA
ncbi:MAG: carboxylesterase/lipase family protein [Friedmanniella sp.]